MIKLALALTMVGGALMSLAQSNPTHTVTLTCTPATTGAVATGFNYYRGTVTGGPYTKQNSSSLPTCGATDTTANGLINGQTYFYVMTATDAGGESAFSNEAKAVIPSTPAPAPPTSLGVTVASNGSVLPTTPASIFKSLPEPPAPTLALLQ